MRELVAQIEEAASAIRRRWSGPARVGIILGTGLGSLASQIETEATFEYPTIPHFPRSTSVGHAGQLVCGRLAGLPVLAGAPRSTGCCPCNGPISSNCSASWAASRSAS